MDTKVVMDFVNGIGFPIAMVVFFAWYMVERDKQLQAKEDKHKEEMVALSEAINNNTLVMEKLISKLDI